MANSRTTDCGKPPEASAPFGRGALIATLRTAPVLASLRVPPYTMP